MTQQTSRIVPFVAALLLGGVAAQAQAPQGQGPQGRGTSRDRGRTGNPSRSGVARAGRRKR